MSEPHLADLLTGILGVGGGFALWGMRPRRVPPAFDLRPDVPLNGIHYLMATRRQWAPERLKQPLEVKLLPKIEVNVQTGNGTTTPAKPGATAEFGPIFFAEGEPKRFAEYEGQEAVIRKLRIQMLGTKKPDDIMRPQLFMGIRGLGKTLIAKVLTNEQWARDEALGMLRGLWIEVFPESFYDLDDIMQLVLQHPRSSLFFDEIHMLSIADQHRLYEFLNNRRFQFKGHTQATQMPETLVTAATTDAGKLLLPLQRRFELHDLEPMSAEAIFKVLQKRASLQFDTMALKQLVDRTQYSGAPWEALGLLELVESNARARNSPVMELMDVQTIFDIEKLDAWGLRAADRRVIQALLQMPRERNRRDGTKEFVCYAGNETNVVTLARVDIQSYRELIRPRLLSRNLITVRPYYGQSLTDLAIARYGKAV